MGLCEKQRYSIYDGSIWSIFHVQKQNNGFYNRFEHIMQGRRAAWSPLWWWPCLRKLKQLACLLPREWGLHEDSGHKALSCLATSVSSQISQIQNNGDHNKQSADNNSSISKSAAKALEPLRRVCYPISAIKYDLYLHLQPTDRKQLVRSFMSATAAE